MDKVLSLLGLCARGNNLVSGEYSTEKAVKQGKARLVVVGEGVRVTVTATKA